MQRVAVLPVFATPDRVGKEAARGYGVAEVLVSRRVVVAVQAQPGGDACFGVGADVFADHIHHRTQRLEMGGRLVRQNGTIRLVVRVDGELAQVGVGHKTLLTISVTAVTAPASEATIKITQPNLPPPPPPSPPPPEDDEPDRPPRDIAACVAAGSERPGMPGCEELTGEPSHHNRSR